TASAEFINDEGHVEDYLEKLDKINFLPDILPVIIKNSHTIELTDEQLNTLLAWSKANRHSLTETANEIVRKRVEIKQAALSPKVSSARLIQMQNKIFRLQREMLKHKLSCRELVINTFNRNNWQGFLLILADREIDATLPEVYLSQW
ncbi:MAG: hypothetical protein KAT61_09695, partial [Gammaproteobacteria bacterium]|nr:hypothetical protein [Gammaproteobacteria bacterium]